MPFGQGDQVAACLRASSQGAMDLLNPLVEAGLVVRRGSKKSGRYLLA